MALNETQPDKLSSGLITASLPTLEDGVNFLPPCLHGRVSTPFLLSIILEATKLDSNGFESKLTTSKWAKIAKCSQDTALRDIQDLISRGLLAKDASGGRSTN